MNARHLKPALLGLLRPATQALIRSGIHPNTLTFGGLLISAAAGWLYAVQALAAAGIAVLIAGLFDVLDGAVAREGRRVSRYGAFLDSNVDRYAEIVVFAGVLWMFRSEPWTMLAVLVAITGSLMVSYSKARAEGLGQEVNGGLLQRPERIILLALGSFTGEAGLRIVVWILAILTNLTTVQRMILVASAMPDEEREPEEPAGEGTVESGEAEPSPPSL